MGEGRETNQSLLADLLSGDRSRVSDATHSIATTRDQETLNFFAAKRGEIEEAMNASQGWDRFDLEDVLEKLTFFVSRPGCWCGWYPRYARFHPKTEHDKGRVAILRQGDYGSDAYFFSGLFFTVHYVCECVDCGMRYDVVVSTDFHTPGCKWTTKATKESLLADLLSRNENRIRTATWEVINTRDAETLTLLAAKRGKIKAATEGLGFAEEGPWMRQHLEFALEKLSFFASGAGCLCRLYPKHRDFNPEVERIDGHVSIIQKTESPDAPRYLCKCVDCGTRYDVVLSGGDNSSWWQWTVREPRWRFWRTG